MAEAPPLPSSDGRARPGRGTRGPALRIPLAGSVFGHYVERHANLPAAAEFDVHEASALRTVAAADCARNVTIHRPGNGERRPRRTVLQRSAQVRETAAARRLGQAAKVEVEGIWFDLAGWAPPPDDIRWLARAMGNDRLVDGGVTWNDRHVVTRLNAIALNQLMIESHEHVIAAEQPVFADVAALGMGMTRRSW